MANRQGTAARIATAQRKISYSGVGMKTDVQVSDRPVTQQGMMGMRVRTAGPGRQVQDNTYYLGLLRNKITEITTEINKFKREISQFHADNSQYAQLERKYEAYIKEVRQLEGQLADYNLAMDKTRTGSDPADLAQYQARLKEKNEYEKREVDNIFMHRKQKDELIQKCESEIISLQQQAEEKINQLAPDKVQEYRQLVQQNQMGQQNAAQLRSELERINQKVRAAEHELNRDQLRDEYHRLVNQVDRLDRERSTLEEEMRTSNMDPEQVRQLLLSKVKEDNAKISQLESSLKTVNDEMGRMRRQIGDHEDQLEQRKSDEGTHQKYEVLFQRDQEMTQFIENYSETEKKGLQEQKDTQQVVVQLLEAMSKDLGRQNSMPTVDQVNEMQSDLTFKERQLKASQSTQERLEAELNKRKAELEKIDQLDKKIALELNNLTVKMASMKDQMLVFKDVENLRDLSDSSRRYLLDLKQQYLRRRDAVKRLLGPLSSSYDRLKNGLLESETGKTLESLEQKLRHYEQNIHHLREFIETKSRETDFRALKDQCGRLLDEINAAVIKKTDSDIGSYQTNSGY
jgi:intraflagellar transport protein 74